MMAGIATGHWLEAMTLTGWLILLVISFLLTGLFLFFGKGEQKLTLTTLLILAFFTIGGLRCHLSDPRYDNHHWTRLVPPQQSNEKSLYSFLILRLKESPSPRERSWRTTAEVESVNGSPSQGEMRLYLKKDSIAARLRYGDRLLVHGLANRETGTLYVTSDHYIVTSRDSISLRARSEKIRMNLLHRAQKGSLEHRHRGVAEAMTLGWRGDLEPDLQTQFRDAGIMHMLCVSGLHVGLLAAIIGWVLAWVGKDRRGRIIRGSAQLGGVWVFVALTGMAPATMRAALMFSLFIVSHMLCRRTNKMNLLAAAAIAMLTADPMLLLNTGWQLSFSAVAGILLMLPVIQAHRNILWQASVVSVSATISTLSITLVTFHQFQPYFLVANIIIVPASALLLSLSLLYVALPCNVTSFLAEWPIMFCDKLTSAISHLPGAVVTDIQPNPWIVTILSVLIIFILITINILYLRYSHSKNELIC